MKPGQESQTAVMVCAARAVADGSPEFAGFSDATAMALLPESTQRHVNRLRARAAKGMREKFSDAFMLGRARMMVARTVAIDAAVQEHPAGQLVLLGAGLDGRAWRMPELRDTIVFEVDHPDSQRAKRMRAARLTQTAREVRSVFTIDQLGALLAHHQFTVGRDHGLQEIATQLSPELGRATRPIRHLRIAVADKT